MADFIIHYNELAWLDLYSDAQQLASVIAKIADIVPDDWDKNVYISSLQEAVSTYHIAVPPDDEISLLLALAPIEPVVIVSVKCDASNPIDALAELELPDEAAGLEWVEMPDGSVGARIANFSPLSELGVPIAAGEVDPIVMSVRYLKLVKHGGESFVASAAFATPRMDVIPQMDDLLWDLLAGVSVS